MYIYLSQRKRRMFLSLPLPQNLSPKKLSFKDKRFLQKSIGNISFPLSLLLIKQQKKLYEKHINWPLKKTHNPINIDQNIYSEVQRGRPKNLFGCPPLCFSLWQKYQKYKSLVLGQKLKAEFCRPSSSVLPDSVHTTILDPQNENKTTRFIGEGLTNQKNYVKAQSNYHASVARPCVTEISYKFTKCGHHGEKPNVKSVLSQPLLYNALCIYTQTVKVKNKGALTSNQHLTHEQCYAKQDLHSFESKKFIKSCFYNPQNVSHILKKFASSPPIFVNGQNKYWFCRFLYNREHIKLSINPQIVQNQKSNLTKSKWQIHEKKKLHYFMDKYQKEISICSQKGHKVYQGDLRTTCIHFWKVE